MTDITFSGGVLEAIRKRRNLSRKDLAQIIGCSESTIYLWESGRGKPRKKFINALSSEFGVKPSYWNPQVANNFTTREKTEMESIFKDKYSKMSREEIVSKIFDLEMKLNKLENKISELETVEKQSLDVNLNIPSIDIFRKAFIDALACYTKVRGGYK